MIFLIKIKLPDGELNPGLPRDRRGYSPLYYLGLYFFHKKKSFIKFLIKNFYVPLRETVLKINYELNMVHLNNGIFVTSSKKILPLILNKTRFDYYQN